MNQSPSCSNIAVNSLCINLPFVNQISAEESAHQRLIGLAGFLMFATVSYATSGRSEKTREHAASHVGCHYQHRITATGRTSLSSAKEFCRTGAYQIDDGTRSAAHGSEQGRGRVLGAFC